jgi:hypothetical protein
MRIHDNASGRRSLMTQATLPAALAIALAACSSTSSTVAQTTGTRHAAGTSIASAAAASTSAAAGTSPPANTSAPAGGSRPASTSPRASSSRPASTSAHARSSPPVAARSLSGTWSGQYSGASQGHFTLNLSQSGSALSGIIEFEADGVSLPIHGTVQGDSIQFGTAGSIGVSCDGTVSGNYMSGTYQLTAEGTTLSGPLSAARSS